MFCYSNGNLTNTISHQRDFQQNNGMVELMLKRVIQAASEVRLQSAEAQWRRPVMRSFSSSGWGVMTVQAEVVKAAGL
jgi:hypothetical protein